MTEHEWQNCDDPVIVMCGLKGRISDRKCRLFDLACADGLSAFWTDQVCRRFARLMRDEIDADNDDADDEIDSLADRINELARSKWQKAAALFAARRSVDAEMTEAIKSYAAVGLLEALHGSMEWWYWLNEYTEVSTPENLDQAFQTFSLSYYRSRLPLLRCIVGNPFRRDTIDPSWLTWNDRTVPKLARRIYDEDRFDLMPILGDALEDAHCNHAEFLTHCREGAPHVRGCWVVDLILDKK